MKSSTSGLSREFSRGAAVATALSLGFQASACFFADAMSSLDIRLASWVNNCWAPFLSSGLFLPAAAMSAHL